MNLTNLDGGIKNIYTEYMSDSEKKKALNQLNREFFYNEVQHDQNYYHINKTMLRDLFPIDVGHEVRLPGSKPTCNNFPYYLIHFVVRGKGFIAFNGLKTAMSRNMLFIVPPETEVVHSTDNRHPWEYFWINFNGMATKRILNELGITTTNFYLKCPNAAIKSQFETALAVKNKRNLQVFTVTSCLLSIFAHIAETMPKTKSSDGDDKTFFEQIYLYITENIYEKSLTAQNIAAHFYITPCYFSTLFKKNLNVSFRKHINYERIKKSTELIETTNLQIKEIAEMVGFTDPLYFGKVFKQYRLVSPQEYRNSKQNS